MRNTVCKPIIVPDGTTTDNGGLEAAPIDHPSRGMIPPTGILRRGSMGEGYGGVGGEVRAGGATGGVPGRPAPGEPPPPILAHGGIRTVDIAAIVIAVVNTANHEITTAMAAHAS